MPHGHIGASDAAALAGVSPYKTAADVWLRLVRGLRSRSNEAAGWGHRLEQAVAQRFADDHRLTLSPAPLLTHPKGREWCRLRLDFEICERPQEAVEVKTTGYQNRNRWGAPGTDDIPIEYLVQVHMELEATGRDRMHVPVLIAGQDYREYVVEHDPEVSGRLIEICEKFWTDHVITGVPPAGPPSRKIIDHLHPKAIEPPRPATSQEVALVRDLHRLQVERDKAKVFAAEAETRVRQVVADAAGLEGPWGRVRLSDVAPKPQTDWKALAHTLAEKAGLNPAEVQEIARQHQKPRASYRRIDVRLKE